MNAPEKITAAEPMNAAHEILMKAASGMCSQEIAAAITGTPRPTKPQIKAAEKMLKAIHDCGMLASQPGRGGVALYSLTTPVCNINKLVDVSPTGEGETAEVCDLVQTGEGSQTSAVIGDSEGGETDAPAISDDVRDQLREMTASAEWPGQGRIDELEATVTLQRETLVVASSDVGRLSAELATAQQGARDALAEAEDLRLRLAESMRIVEMWRERMSRAIGQDSPESVVAGINALRAELGAERLAQAAGAEVIPFRRSS